MEQNIKNKRTRCIKLPVALGDWINLKPFYSGYDESPTGKANNSTFESLSQEDLNYCLLLHYRLAENIQSKFAQDMNLSVELHSIQATQLAYEDFLYAQKQKIVQADLQLPNLGIANIILEWPLADLIVNRLTGGKGEVSGVDRFSPMETTILQTLIGELLPFFCFSWRNLIRAEDIDLTFNCGSYIYDKKSALRDAYVYFSLFFNIEHHDERKVIFGFPLTVLRALLKLRRSVNDPVKRRVYLNSQSLSQIMVPVQSILGIATITMKEFRSLQKGDVVQLDNKLTDPVEVILGDKVKALAQPGQVGQKMALQLLSMNNEHYTKTSAEQDYSEDFDTPQPEQTFTPMPPPVPIENTVREPLNLEPASSEDIMNADNLIEKQESMTLDNEAAPVLDNDDFNEDRFDSPNTASSENPDSDPVKVSDRKPAEDIIENDDSIDDDDDFSWDDDDF